MLLIGQTYQQRKAGLLDTVKDCRKMNRLADDCIKQHPEIRDNCIEAIESGNELIKITMLELARLERWRITKGYDKNEPYNPKVKHDQK